MYDPLIRRPAVPLALGLALGIVAQSVFGFGGVAVFIAACLAIALYVMRLNAATVVMAAFTAGVFCARLSAPVELPDYHFDGNERVYSGVVERHETRAASQLCDVRVASGFLCRVTVGDIMPLMRAGDSIMFRAALERIDMEPGFYDEISEASRLRSRGYSAKALVRSSDCDITGEDNSLKYRLRHLADDFAALAYASPLSQSTSRLAVAAGLGDSSAAVPETVESYRASGIAHLLCVSGFHVGIIAAFLAFALYPLRLWSRAGRLRYLFSIAGIWFYAFMTGLQPSVFRASVMITVFLSAAFMQRSADRFNSLALAVAVILLVEPLSLFSVGFQLSVTAVLGLLLFADKLNPVPEHRRHLRAVAGLFSSSLAATIASLPVLLYAFHRLPVFFLLANVVGMLLFPPLLAGSWIVAVLSSAGIVMCLPAKLIDSISYVIDYVAELCASYTLPMFEEIYMTAPALIMLVIAVVSLALALHHADRRMRVLAGAGAMALFVCAACEPQSGKRLPDLRQIGDVIICDGKIIVCPDALSDGRNWPEKVDYMLITRGAKVQELKNFVEVCRPDTILIDQRLPLRRKEFVKRTVEDAGIPIKQDFRMPYRSVLQSRD